LDMMGALPGTSNSRRVLSAALIVSCCFGTRRTALPVASNPRAFAPGALLIQNGLFDSDPVADIDELSGF